LESNWRQNVPGLELVNTQWIRVARKLSGPFPGQYLAKRDNGQSWWITINYSTSGAQNVTMHTSTTLSWTLLMNAGIIEAD